MSFKLILIILAICTCSMARACNLEATGCLREDVHVVKQAAKLGELQFSKIPRQVLANDAARLGVMSAVGGGVMVGVGRLFGVAWDRLWMRAGAAALVAGGFFMTGGVAVIAVGAVVFYFTSPTTAHTGVDTNFYLTDQGFPKLFALSESKILALARQDIRLAVLIHGIAIDVNAVRFSPGSKIPIPLFSEMISKR